MNKKNILILLIILVIAVAAGVLWYLNRNVGKPVVEEGNNQGTEKIDTSNWKIYRNEEYEFEVKYPEWWYIFDCASQYFASLRVYISDNQSDNCNTKGGRINIVMYNKDQINFYKNYDFYEDKEIKIDSKIIKQVNGYYEVKGGEGESLPPKPMQKARLTFIPYNDKYITISYNELFEIEEGFDNFGFKIDKDYNNIYDKLISSFEFLEDKEIDTSDWWTYQNEEFGFELKYPKNYTLEDVANKWSGDDPAAYPWYARTDYLLSTIILKNSLNGDTALNLRVLNTMDEEKIKISGGWESIQKIGERKIGKYNFKVYSIDQGTPNMIFTSLNGKSYVFLNYLSNKKIEAIISTFGFAELNK